MSITKRLLSDVTEKRSTGEFGSSAIPSNGSLAGTVAGVPINETTAMQLMTVYSCVNLIADVLSTLPIDEFVKRGKKRVKLDPQSPLIAQPNLDMEREDFVAQYVYSMLLRGNFYGKVIERDKFGYAMQIQPVHPDSVQVRLNTQTNKVEYRFNRELIGPDDVFHVPGLRPPGSLVGLNPIQLARQGLGLAVAAERFGAQFFQNGATSSGMVSTQADLNYDQTLVLARQFAAKHQGLENAHLPIILTAGATWEQLSVNPDDAQFLQTRGFQKVEIYGMFRVPPHKLGDVDKTTSWGTGIESQEISFLRDTLRPLMTRLESAFNRQLPETNYSRFNPEERLRADTITRYQAYTLARNGSWMSPDEIREKEDEEPIPDGLGADFFSPMNTLPLDKLVPDPTAAPTTPPPAPPADNGGDKNAE